MAGAFTNIAFTENVKAQHINWDILIELSCLYSVKV